MVSYIEGNGTLCNHSEGGKIKATFSGKMSLIKEPVLLLPCMVLGEANLKSEGGKLEEYQQRLAHRCSPCENFAHT